jgi:hypothetical protein
MTPNLNQVYTYQTVIVLYAKKRDIFIFSSRMFSGRQAQEHAFGHFKTTQQKAIAARHVKQQCTPVV